MGFLFFFVTDRTDSTLQDHLVCQRSPSSPPATALLSCGRTHHCRRTAMGLQPRSIYRNLLYNRFHLRHCGSQSQCKRKKRFRQKSERTSKTSPRLSSLRLGYPWKNNDIIQHHVYGFRRQDSNNPGHHKIVSLVFVESNVEMLSSAGIPCQRKDWWCGY